MLLHSLRRLGALPEIERIALVIHPEDPHWPRLSAEIESEFGSRLLTISGGDERYQSVLNGLNAFEQQAQDDDWVLVHDAVRPCVRPQDIARLIRAAGSHSVGGLLGSPVANTLKRVAEDGAVVETVDRESYWNALTPQMFRFGPLRTAIGTIVAAGEQATDEAAAMESAGHRPIMVAGNNDNIKITFEADLLLAAQILESQAAEDSGSGD